MTNIKNIRLMTINTLLSGKGLEDTRRNDMLSSALCLLGAFFLTVFGVKSYLSGLHPMYRPIGFCALYFFHLGPI